MTLTPGTRLGPYEITAQIGKGGMGEVYQATDTNLGRQVAIKVLPEAFARDPDRLVRFEREARTLASLNHPNIAQIHGLEQSGGMTALVMELVDGEDLSQRIARGAMPIDEALPIAKQIAEALEAAHEQGIIHRDLKPANIRVRPDGAVKVLDFGLAKLIDPNEGPNASNNLDVLSQAPTITSPAMMTGVGVILGTAAYMSPEQARGRSADRRSDVWSFGCVLYEMLTGRGPFAGEDMSDTLANVLKREPDFSLLPAGVPLPVRTLLQRCLVKDRRKRIADIAAALFVLEHQVGDAATSPVSAAPPVRRPVWRRAMPMAVAVAITTLLAGAGIWWLTRPASPSVVRTTITTPAVSDLAVTPDGTRVIYRNGNELLIRALDQLEPTVLRGLIAPRGLFVSPDGQWVGSFDSDVLKKIALTGGPPVSVCATQGQPNGATWGKDGSIIFATSSIDVGLQRVSASGGEPTVLTKPDRARGEGDHVWPELLPSDQAVLFTITPASGAVDPASGALDNAQIAVLDLQTRTSKVLIRGGSHAHYVPTGHLVYGVGGTLHAVAFDLRRLEVVGTPTLVLSEVLANNQGSYDVAVAANGSLVYVRGANDQRAVVSVDRQGHASPLPNTPLGSYRDVRVSPDGAQLVLSTLNDVWIYHFARATLSRLTTDPAPDHSPLWTPDGQRIIFTSRRAGYPEVFWRPADGTGRDERLLARTKNLQDLRANSWSADGRQLVISELPVGGQCAIEQIPVERPSEVKVLVKSEFCSDYSAISPDGRWMAYESRVSGRTEIYVERYPELGSRQQISTGGGRIPLWSPNNRELFFSSLDRRQMLAVAVQSGTTLIARRPQVLFEFPMFVAPGGQPYDIAPDGRFIMIRGAQGEADGGTPPNMIVVQNWTEELKRLVPAN